MLRNLGDILKFDVTTQGEKVGTVDDIIFDQVVWTARYVVVSIGGWLQRQKAIVPRQTATIHANNKRVEVSLTDRELAYSVRESRRRLIGKDQVATATIEAATAGGSGSEPLTGEAEGGLVLDPDLRSAGAIVGFKAWGEDGRLGYVEDFIIDDETWIVQGLVLAARRWLPSRSVILPVPWVDRVERDESALVCRLPQRAVTAAPDYERGTPLDTETLDAYWEQYRRAEET